SGRDRTLNLPEEVHVMSPVLNKYNFCIDALLCFVLILSLIGIPTTLTIPALASTSRLLPTHRVSQSDPGALPLSFELNQGQTNDEVKFLARSGGYVLFLTPTEAVMALDNPAAHKQGKENRASRSRTGDIESGDSRTRPPRPIVRMKLEGANPDPQVEGLEQLSTTSNYFAGSDPAAWHTNISSFTRVRYAQVYPG